MTKKNDVEKVKKELTDSVVTNHRLIDWYTLVLNGAIEKLAGMVANLEDQDLAISNYWQLREMLDDIIDEAAWAKRQTRVIDKVHDENVIVEKCLEVLEIDHIEERK